MTGVGGSGRSYFDNSVAAYALGLGLCFSVNFISKSGQPGERGGFHQLTCLCEKTRKENEDSEARKRQCLMLPQAGEREDLQRLANAGIKKHMGHEDDQARKASIPHSFTDHGTVCLAQDSYPDAGLHSLGLAPARN